MVMPVRFHSPRFVGARKILLVRGLVAACCGLAFDLLRPQYSAIAIAIPIMLVMGLIPFVATYRNWRVIVPATFVLAWAVATVGMMVFRGIPPTDLFVAFFSMVTIVALSEGAFSRSIANAVLSTVTAFAFAGVVAWLFRRAHQVDLPNEVFHRGKFAAVFASFHLGLGSVSVILRSRFHPERTSEPRIVDGHEPASRWSRFAFPITVLVLGIATIAAARFAAQWDNPYREEKRCIDGDYSAGNALNCSHCCENGVAECCRELGYQTYEGWDVVTDVRRSTVLFEKACELGDSEGCAYFGRALFYGWEISRDQERALILLERSCRHLLSRYEVMDGCFYLGVMLEKGQETGTEPDRLRARQVFARSCARGSASGRVRQKMLERIVEKTR